MYPAYARVMDVFIVLFLSLLLSGSLFTGLSRCSAQDGPVVEITRPENHEEISGGVVVRGNVSDVTEEDSCKVEVKVDDGDWMDVDETMPGDGVVVWVCGWDSTEVSNGQHTIHARAQDGSRWSEIASVFIFVNNTVTAKDKGNDNGFKIAGMNGYAVMGGVGSVFLIIAIVIMVVMKGSRKDPGSSDPGWKDAEAAQYVSQPPQAPQSTAPAPPVAQTPITQNMNMPAVTGAPTGPVPARNPRNMNLPVAPGPPSPAPQGQSIPGQTIPPVGGPPQPSPPGQPPPSAMTGAAPFHPSQGGAAGLPTVPGGFPSPRQLPVDAVYRCTRCGNPVDEKPSFCMKCGAPRAR